MKFLEVIDEMFFPSDIKCIVCDGELSFSTRYCLCEKCKFEYNTKYCLKCGRKVGDMTPYCIDCTNRTHEFDVARAPFVYENNVKKLIYRLKYGNKAYIAKYLAQFMYDAFLEYGVDVDLVTFVPMPKQRERERGYNQAEKIANEFSLLSNIPIKKLLKRSKYTKNLAKMSREERKSAITDSFEIIDRNSVKGKRILLIDDVFTSGATTNECAKTLKKAKANFVFALTFATSSDKIQLY